MTAKPQITDGSGVRVGVPLARAQRLAARRETPRRRSPVPALLIGTAFAGLVAAALLAPARGPDQVASAFVVEEVAQTSLGSSPAGAADFANLPQLPRAHVDRRARIFPCVAGVEDGLRTLGGMDSSPDAAAERSRALAALVQATLDCRFAKVEIEGSLELIDARLADLRIDWSRETSHLHLTVIDEIDPADAQVTYAEDGLPLMFVVH